MGRIDMDWNCAPSVTCFGSIYMFLDHGQKRIYTVDFGDADDC